MPDPLPPHGRRTEKKEVVQNVHYIVRPLHIKIGFNIHLGWDKSLLNQLDDRQLEAYVESYLSTLLEDIIQEYEEDVNDQTYPDDEVSH